MNKKSTSVFNWIAPIYGLFYNYQIRHYKEILDGALYELDFSQYKNIIDVGCGTGALCSVLNQKGLRVTGVDPAQKMLQIAAKKQGNKNIEFVQTSAIERMPFENKSFDISIASFVAHGLKEDDRKTMYAEMSRITRNFVIINDYNEKRSLLVNIAEWLEGGDYFNFIKKAQDEMKEVFDEVRIVNVGSRAACNICRPFAEKK